MVKALVHGNPETAVLWDGLVDALRVQGVEDVVRLSPPGFGAKVPEGFDATRERYVEWLAGELEQLGGPVDLVGHDWGAGHVYGVTAERPDLVRSWAADCAGILHPHYVWHDLAQVWQQPEAGEAAIGQMMSASASDRAALLRSLGVADAAAEDFARALDADMGRCILALYRSAAQPAMRVLGERLERAERRPGLVIDPTEDPYVQSSLGREVARRLGAELLTLEGRGHWWMFEDLTPVAEALAAFWRSLPD